ncbi:ribonuclease HII [Gleimia sp. 6138-11-ORH1]|uniref:ribonuclease HII n=1 Tax=Gleimia sp. 6138-11-ORH1 TaxID=2973937 RepID=UPI0021672385|nr:ribonuclease HII [Gleimia sp. 6138-11-ORH1]MCS4484889.1 ribonuclease HII [Gleimia sp. 6138-11-ORH1]
MTGSVKFQTSPSYERELSAKYGIVIGMDEVGRGALAGPVGVGAAVASFSEPPAGLTDSKALNVKQRNTYVKLAADWALASAVCFSDNTVVDSEGIVTAMRIAGISALEKIKAAGYVANVVLLDGSHDWLTPPQDLLSFATDPLVARFDAVGAPQVIMKVKADAQCTVVAAASVIAKVARDEYMETVTDPGYGWARNKGYGSAAHKKAIAALGPSSLHRTSWKLV